MAQPVILAEKPSQARNYFSAYQVKNKTKHYVEIEPNKTFPDGAIVVWAIGHLVELQPPEFYDSKYKNWSMDNLPILPDKFIYKTSKDKKQHFNAIADILKKASYIVIATDPDREGEAIARLIINHANAKDKKIKRLWINSLEKDAVQEGMNNLLDGKDTYNYFIEAQTRQHADWVVGMNLSPLYSLQLQEKGFDGSLSIGRVQSPTVFLIYKRQKEIENFKSEPFYEIQSTFNHENGKYTGKANVKEGEKSKVEDILKGYGINSNEKGYIKEVSNSTKVKGSPKLHSLSSLQTKANKQWKYSPKKVLEIAQSLYDKKYLSYPRTDSNYITEREYAYLLENVQSYQDLLNVNFEVNQENKKYVSNEKVAEHYAIIPTRTIPDLNALSSEERNVFLEILRTTLAMFHHDNIVNETVIITNVKGLEFRSKGTTPQQEGWASLFPKDKKKDKKEILPKAEKGDHVESIVNIKEGKTEPPKRFTEGQLVDVMITCGKHVEDEDDANTLKETEGIGTEATRGDIIEKIKSQGYIESKKNLLYVTKKGELLCKAIEGTLLSSPEMTSQWEQYLKKISNNNGSKDKFLNQIQAFIQKMIHEAPDQLKRQDITNQINEFIKDKEICVCPSCEGSIQDKGKFFGCSGYKEGCRVTFPKKWAGKTLSKKDIQNLCKNKETNKISGFKGKNGDFSASLILDDKYQVKFNFNNQVQS